jgi:hypothetical protein
MNDSIQTQLGLDNPLAQRLFVDIIQEMVKKEIRNAGLVKLVPATVTAVAGGTGLLTVKLNGDAVEISGIKNKTGESLLANDQVYLIFIGGSATNSCALIKK